MGDNNEEEIQPRFIGVDAMLYSARDNAEWNMGTWTRARWNQWGVYARPEPTGSFPTDTRYFYFDLEERTLMQFNPVTNDIVVCWEQAYLIKLIYHYLLDVLPSADENAVALQSANGSGGSQHGVVEIPSRDPPVSLFSDTTISLPTPLEWIAKFRCLNGDIALEPRPYDRHRPPNDDNRILRMDLTKCELAVMTKLGRANRRHPWSRILFGEYATVWNKGEHYRYMMGYFVDHLGFGLDEVAPLLYPEEWLAKEQPYPTT